MKLILFDVAVSPLDNFLADFLYYIFHPYLLPITLLIAFVLFVTAFILIRHVRKRITNKQKQKNAAHPDDEPPCPD